MALTRYDSLEATVLRKQQCALACGYTHTLVLTVPLVTLGPLPPITNDQETRGFYCCDA